MRKRWVVITILAMIGSWWASPLAQKGPSDGTQWLLTSPIRQYLSGAGETFLMHKHGLLPRPSVAAGEEALNLNSVETNVRVNNPTTDTGKNRTQSEPSVAVFGVNVVVGFNDSGGLATSGNFTGYSFSTDSGTIFTDAGPLSGPLGGHTGGDPILAADHLGNFYFATIATQANGNHIIGVAKSTDGGKTFNPQVEASVGISNPDDFQDKENMAVDTHTGSPFQENIYVCWTDFFRTGFFKAGRNRIVFSRSTDGGTSFSTAVSISTFGAPVQGCAIAVGPSGEVYVAWEDFRSPQAIRISKSTDGGQTFGADDLDNSIVALVAPVGERTSFRCASREDLLAGKETTRFVLKGDIRVNNYPSIAVNLMNGEIYVVFNSHPAGGDQADVFFVRSMNGGVNWSTPARVNDDATTSDQWFPNIAVQSNGTIGVMCYDRRLDTTNFKIDVFLATSTNGGNTFSVNQRVTDVSFGVPPLRPNFDPAVAKCYMGDYNGIVADSTWFYLAWGDNRDLTAGIPDPNVYTTAITFSPQTSITLASGLRGPYRLTLDQNNVYWVESFGGITTVKKIALSGGTPSIIATQNFGLGGSSGIAVDGTSVYWSFSYGSGSGSIYKAPIQGGTITFLAPANQPTDVATDGIYLYWVETNSGTESLTGVRKVPTAGGAVITLTTLGNQYTAIGFDDFDIYYGYILSDCCGYTNNIAKISKDGGAVINLVSNLDELPSDISVDDNNIYWAESSFGRLKSLPKSGGIVTTLASGLNNPTQIAIDMNNVYWAEFARGVAGAGMIKKLPIAGGEISILANNLNGPTDIAVDETTVYWTEFGTDGTDGTIKKMSK